MALLDPTIIKQLVETQLLTVSTGVVPAGQVYFPGQAVPDGTGALARSLKLVAIDLSRGEAPRSGLNQDEPDHWDVVVTVNAYCSRDQMALNSGSLSSLLSEVAAKLAQATLRDVATNHQVDLFECRIVVDRPGDEQRQTATGAVIATGTACRTSGTTLAAMVS